MKSMKRGDRRAEAHRHAMRRVRLDRAEHPNAPRDLRQGRRPQHTRLEAS